jgi:ubiquitin carboxyl-terminal hydrolase 7
VISLNRFDYDWQKGIRIKLNNKFEYPNSIDMNDFIEVNEENLKLTDKQTTYDLFSVIIHQGSAHKGF